MSKLLDPFRFLLVTVAGWMSQRQLQVIEYLREENRVLREQLGGKRPRLNDDQRRRLAAKAKGLGRTILVEVATIVTPETLLAWHRKLIAQKYDGSCKRAPGRPRTSGELEALVVRLACENRDWGYRRIQGVLSNLGHEIAESTIAAILKRHGLEPAPERTRKTTWKEFLTRHWDLIVATDFFTVEVWTKRGLQRFMVLFFIDLATRKVEIAGIAPVVNGLWMNQVARVDHWMSGQHIQTPHSIPDLEPRRRVPDQQHLPSGARVLLVGVPDIVIGPLPLAHWIERQNHIAQSSQPLAALLVWACFERSEFSTAAAGVHLWKSSFAALAIAAHRR